MKIKPSLIITAVFLIYGFLLTPLGHIDLPTIKDLNPGYYSIRTIDPGDDSGYYAYVRSTVIDGDLDFFNEKYFWHFDSVVDTGYTANYWYIGAPILWAPFFLTGHLITLVYQSLGIPFSLDGYSLPYKGMTFIGSAFLSLSGLLICFACLRKHFHEKIALGTTLLVFAATCLPYFTFIRNRMSHSGDVFIAFAFFYFFLAYRENRRQPAWFFIAWGLLLGLLTDLRYISILYAILPVGQMLVYGARLPKTSRTSLWTGLVWGIVGFLIAFSPQAAFWLRIHGSFSSLNPYSIMVEPTVASVFHSIGELFFNGTRGLLKMEFIWVLGLCGLPLVWKRDRTLAIMLSLVFIGFCVPQIVIMDPATFGQRYLLPALPVLAWGLAQLTETLSRLKQWRLIFTAGIAGSLWIYILILNYKVILPHNDPEFLWHALQGLPNLMNRPEFFRPTTFLDLWASGELRLRTAQDWFFLVVLPLLTVVLCIFALAISWKPLPSSSRNSLRKNVVSFGGIFCIVLTLWIIARHPAFPRQETAERYRTAAISKWFKDPAHTETTQKLLNKSEKLNPQEAETWRIRGDLAFMQGDWPTAEQFYQQAILRDNNTPARVQLERVRLIMRKKSENEQDVTILNEVRRGYQLLDFQKQPFQALEVFKSALRLNPSSPYSSGLIALLRQHSQQNIRMRQAGNQSQGISDISWMLLGTSLNEVRLNLPLFQQRIKF
ncbi:MAG: hypothetical protein G3M70_01600 [Candidatus Nitronauta litoralis]|uniref:Glycosyltransferase RgtA/B/C/D-like domain-containing protein n=1 Tax=Candidatus Nitronauta litoralis TaxID=2705533 RepID=A0A7T0FYL3_9BACT|nr:MAG: hypothetical protein G3M70_01600 [Candidatus Nitronauta litoralis]